MSVKRWVLLFFGVLLGCTVLFAVYNVVLDPFGVFGDPVLDWYEYDMTMNPRVAKIAYLDRNHGRYDSYVIGSSKASSLSVNELNAYMDASFYNMTWYGGDLADEVEVVRYIIENYTVKNIVLAVDPENAALYDTETDPIKGNMHCKVDRSSALRFYGKYLFANPQYGLDKLAAYRRRGYLMQSEAVYIAESGVYNKQRRDATAIGEMSAYLAAENNVFHEADSDLPYIDEAIAAISDIKRMCETHRVSLLVIGVPIQRDDFVRYDRERLALFWERLAQTTDFYEFWGYNSVNNDMRYYYDTDHFRNNAGTMVLAYIFGNPDVYIPGNFGHLTTAANVRERIAAAYEDGEADAYTAEVPVLMYHSFTEDPGEVDYTTVLLEDFRSQVAALRDEGYRTVTYQDLIDYVRLGTELPEKPVLISIDDGYQDNLELAVPVLEEAGFSATIAVIGCSVGKTDYKDTGTPITPHFSLESAAPYVERGVLDIQTHSYDMHQVAALDGEDCRQGVLRREGESEEDYLTALASDVSRAREQITSVLDSAVQVYTYPYGWYDTMTEVALHNLGFQVTVTTEPGVNEIIKGIPQSLYLLKRITVAGGVSGGELMQTMSGFLSGDGGAESSAHDNTGGE